MASSQASKIALGLQKYRKPIPHPFNRNITEQLNEYYGIGNFHCKEHEILALALRDISLKYKTASLERKKALAVEEVVEWEKYIDSRVPTLPDTYKITDQVRARIHRIWSQMLHRETDSIECKRMLDFHGKFVEHYPFEVPIDKKSLVEMIHPHGGYLSLTPRSFTLFQMMDFYKIQILASFERSLGEDLLSRSLSAFNYYRSIQGSEPNWLDKQKTNEMLVSLKFPIANSLKSFKNEFEWTLKEFENEFEFMKDDEFFVRFAVFRKLFLDFNL